MKITEIIIVLLFILLVISFYSIVVSTNNRCNVCQSCSEIVEALETHKMLNISISPNVRTYGIYRADEYFCVWTNNRTQEEINNTFCHESCHDFVYKDYSHFCEGKNE